MTTLTTGSTVEITPASDLAPLVGRLVRVERVSFGVPGHFVGRFTDLSHCAPRDRRQKEPGAGGTFVEATTRGALALPYGLSTVTVLD